MRIATKPKPWLSSPLLSAGPPAQKRVRSSTDVEERSKLPLHSSELELEDLEPEASSLPCDGPQKLKFPDAVLWLSPVNRDLLQRITVHDSLPQQRRGGRRLSSNNFLNFAATHTVLFATGRWRQPPFPQHSTVGASRSRCSPFCCSRRDIMPSIEMELCSTANPLFSFRVGKPHYKKP